MRHRLILLIAAILLFATAAPVAAEPGNSPSFEVVPVVDTFPDYPNPCTGAARDITLDGELYVHEFERPNGYHLNIVFFFGATTSDGFTAERRMVGAQTLNINRDNEVFNEADNWMFTNDTKDKYRAKFRWQSLRRWGGLGHRGGGRVTSTLTSERPLRCHAIVCRQAPLPLPAPADG